MTKAQTGTESYVTCKTGGGRVKTLENRLSETTLPKFETYEKTPKKPASGHEDKARPNAEKEGRFASRRHIQGICPGRMFFDILSAVVV
jgi:hypothetical protein